MNENKKIMRYKIIILLKILIKIRNTKNKFLKMIKYCKIDLVLIKF